MAKKKKPGKPKATRFVLDGSVTLVWAFEDETDPYAEAVADSLADVPAIVPALWRLELANALLVGERRSRITEAKVSQFLTLLQSLPISVDDETALRAWPDTLPLARLHDLTVYDAAYLELAVRLGLPLASLDTHLKEAAAAAGVPEYEP
ncbi:MAG TPA: type II toxin-antitoxin system VapC family toxin [Gemmataceae bacterium]|nr:type II toxin-antitoxin system VapC family toxin [Gemmataceae bacterium]